MGDTRKVVIEIVEGNGGGGTPTTPNNTTIINQTITNKTINNSAPSVGEVSLVSILANQIYGQAKSLVKNATMYYINRHLTLKEDYMNERNLNNALTLINKGVSFATAVGGGAMLGGPLGAAISAVGWVVNQAFGEYQRFDTAYRGLSENKINLAFQRTRVGLSGEGRTEN